MNKEAALAILQLQGNENRASVARAYGEQLALVQEQLVSAETEAERNAHGARLAELSQAYELITGTGRYATSNEAATVLRSGTEVLPASYAPPLAHMEPGAVIADRIEIGGLLGEGGMGCVYAARDRLKGEDVAIKVLREDLQFSMEAKDRFLSEAKVSCSLSHPNIVRVHDVGVTGGAYYLSMERLKGHTLRQHMDQYRKKNRAFRLAEVTDIARQLIDALRYANRYIIHRDIKPENIWLAEDGTVKLMDFGIARAFSNSQMTQTGMMLGTAYYMSPEQRAGSKKIDWRTDQYALGVVLYELFTGTLPTGAVQPIEKLRRDLPKRYADALMRAMAPLPQKRFASFDEMLAEIQAPRPKSFRFTRLVIIWAALAAAFVAANDRGWIMTLSAAATALKTELWAAGALVTGNSPSSAGVASSTPAVSPPPEETRAAAAVVTEPMLVPESESMPAELTSAQMQPAALESAAQPVALESIALSPGASESGAPSQTPAQSSPDVISAALVSEVSPQAETNAITAAASGSPLPESSGIGTRRDQCIAECERADGECRSLSRRGMQECMQAVAARGNSSRIDATNVAATSCAFFGPPRCDSALDRDACLARVSHRYDSCVNAFTGSVISRGQDCDDKARESDHLCLDELRDCRRACE